MTDLIDYYRRGWLCIGYNDECRDRSSGCPCTETAEALEAQQAVINAAVDLLEDQLETENEFELEWDRHVREWLLSVSKLRKSDE